MRENNLNNCRKKLKTVLDKERYEHTIGVMYTASALAMCYDCNLEKAMIAGLLHDCAKCIPNEKKLQLCQKHNISISEYEKNNPFLLHTKLGAFLAMHKYHITDRDVISAILNHTTGKPNMSLLDKIVYVSDYIEPNRDRTPRLPQIRKLAFTNLDLALLEILKDTLDHLKKCEGEIDPMTEKTYEYYKESLKGVMDGAIEKND